VFYPHQARGDIRKDITNEDLFELSHEAGFEKEKQRTKEHGGLTISETVWLRVLARAME
jgi:hypothetical protein